jgi:hypothetical protein
MSNWSGVTPDQLVAAMHQYVLRPDEAVKKRRDYDDSVVIKTRYVSYDAGRADWRIDAAPWVAAAIRVVADGGMTSSAVTHGLIFEHGGPVRYLNDFAAMRSLGARVGPDLDPLAYAEVLAELYSGPKIDPPLVRPRAVNLFSGVRPTA